jgi:hypothetical protein
VAEAARVSPIAFRPLHRQRSDHPAGSAPPPATAPVPAPVDKAAALAKAAGAPATAQRAVVPATSPAPLRTAEAGRPAAPVRPVTRPGAARLLPGEAARRPVPERAVRQQRFTKTIAELERHQAATRPDEPWGNVVPRPAVPQSNPVASDSRWSRLWPRR